MNGIQSFRYSLRMHGKTHKGQTIHTCTDCEFSATNSQQLEDHMNKHRGTRPFQCSECGLMFAARADLRAHVTRTHRALAVSGVGSTIINNGDNTRPQRRIASLKHSFIGVSSGVDDTDQQHNPHSEDDFRCPICNRQFTSARLLDRHTYAVHEPKQESYDDHDYRSQDLAFHQATGDEDDIHDYADDEIEEKEKEKNRLHNKSEHEQLEVATDEPMHERVDYQYSDEINEEEDLAPNVEDIVDEDQEEDHDLTTIKAVSSAGRKQNNDTNQSLSSENQSIIRCK